jgi:cytochrome c oxidase subunit 4
MVEHEDNHSLRPYVLVLLALFGLTGLTVGAAYVDFGHPWSDVVALVIALLKASLVVTFFMHVKGSTSMIKIAVASGVIGVLIFFMIILTDYLGRGI